MLVRIKSITENTLGKQGNKHKELWGELVTLLVLSLYAELKPTNRDKPTKTVVHTCVRISGDDITLETTQSIYRLEVVRENI